MGIVNFTLCSEIILQDEFKKMDKYVMKRTNWKYQLKKQHTQKRLRAEIGILVDQPKHNGSGNTLQEKHFQTQCIGIGY